MLPVVQIHSHLLSQLVVSYIPNLITVLRIAAAPVLVLLLDSQAYNLALIVFLAAGISDALDGFIAKSFNFESEFGAILDPVADKILLVSSFVMLTLLGHLPFWLLVIVGFRDILIAGLTKSAGPDPVRLRHSLVLNRGDVAGIGGDESQCGQQTQHRVPDSSGGVGVRATGRLDRYATGNRRFDCGCRINHRAQRNPLCLGVGVREGRYRQGVTLQYAD